ncbi:MAG: AraC family transcriptional regulator [Oscillospiraceae bacterium]|nr:AraC family transcriptional regulator [Oscillospiraceae bacterium]
MNRHTQMPRSGIERVHADRRTRARGYVMPAYHCHTYYELYCVERGACRFLVEDSMYDLRAGDFLLIPPQLLHYTRYPFGDCRRSTVLFRGEDVDEAVRACLPEGAAFLARLRIFRAPEAHRGELSALLGRMVTEERIRDARSALLLRTRLQELLLLCARECDCLHDAPANIRTTEDSVLRSAQFISAHYAEPINTADVATAVGFSPNYLSRKFREAAGIGVHEYLVLTRLRHAALELLATEDSVTEIALRCGFSGSNYFKDAFKKKYGVTPRDYRRMG